MEMKDLELKLLAAEPIDVGVGKIHHPTLREIIAMDESIYQQNLSLLLFDQKNIQGSEDEGLSNYYFLIRYCYYVEQFKNAFLDSFKLIFKEEAHLYASSDDAFFYLGEKDRRIDEDTFNLIQTVVRKAAFIAEPEEVELKPGNEQARKYIEEMNKRKQSQSNSKETMTLHSVINGLSWKSENINIFNVFDLTIYQLYSGFHCLQTIDNYHYTLHGIYSGAIDGKKIKLDQMHWAKIHDRNK